MQYFTHIKLLYKFTRIIIITMGSIQTKLRKVLSKDINSINYKRVLRGFLNDDIAIGYVACLFMNDIITNKEHNYILLSK